MAARKATARKSSQPVKKATAAKKKVVKKTAPKSVTKQVVTKKAVKKPTISPNRPSWVDELTQTPLIDDYARQLESFISAMADGRVDENEVKGQEQRVVKLLKEIDPQLADALHAKVTQLLCELTAYAIMQMLYAMEQTRPKAVFQG